VLIAVRNFDDAVDRFSTVLGTKPRLATFQAEGVRSAFFPLGDSGLELISPLKPDIPLERFLNSRGEGLFGVSLEVDNIEESIKSLEANQVRLLAQEPSVDELGYRYVYSHPKSLHGVEIEFTEPPSTTQP
jgi:methylmalonyl-CoA epimerase